MADRILIMRVIIIGKPHIWRGSANRDPENILTIDG